MKVAIASDDGKTISQHFGRTRGFVIYELDGNKILNRNYRINNFTGHMKGLEGQHHGTVDKHGAILTALSDCSVVCARGMGRRIYDDLAGANIEVFVVKEEEADKALTLYLENNLKDHPEDSCEH